jgi:type II secretory pathway pseudopilin PulG
MAAPEVKMTLTTGNSRSRSNRAGHSAFTLVELILVMTLLMIVLAVSAPSLQGFFKGRNLDSEARRIYSLTRYGQSRAVSESIPMLLWFDTRQKTYGLRAASSYLEVDPRSVEFALDRDLDWEIRSPQLASGVLLTPFVDRNIGTLPTIRFSPDGSIAETSPETILLTQAQKDAVAIAINTNRLRYDILPGNGYAYRR